MYIVPSRFAGLSLVAVTWVALSGCKAKETGATADTTSAAMSPAPADTSAASQSAATPATTALTDANIVALLDEANMADSALGASALPKATSASVKSFARLMMGEHHALRVMGQDLAKKQSITPQLPTDDPFTKAVQDEQAALDAAPKGHAFDSTYIDHEIGIHQAVMGWAGTAEAQAQNQALKDLIKAAGPILQKHLDRAQAAQKELAK
jgi:predicted outer membrane protein